MGLLQGYPGVCDVVTMWVKDICRNDARRSVVLRPTIPHSELLSPVPEDLAKGRCYIGTKLLVHLCDR